MRIIARREIKFKRPTAFGTIVINPSMKPVEVPDWIASTNEFESYLKSGNLVVIGAATPIKRLDKEHLTRLTAEME